MTFKILTLDTDKIIYRSTVRSASDPMIKNKRIDELGEEEIPLDTDKIYVRSRGDNSIAEDYVKIIPNFSQEEIIGRNYL